MGKDVATDADAAAVLHFSFLSQLLLLLLLSFVILYRPSGNVLLGYRAWKFCLLFLPSAFQLVVETRLHVTGI